ncbi:Predicted O-methyltransferase YrrM [Reichenbachiella faecimaris]|uniref:Predicted O-methyltransferase YrrM n=1 Tax=Reichenbachiella faecimaris TaxID=692418 RepID=A0A1W2G5V4_REIFA|nr:class I SAM-dependent methyltransferase [Reichenbachiella faecimaris]SMD31914.1 Predicted O-methyltransferase YrrM [Reichenbachiella faecimaris]
MDEHSLQSPFLFRVYQKALNPTSRKSVHHQNIEELRQQLYLDSRSIKSNNFGSGSSLSSNRSKEVSSIAKSGITERWQSEILINLIEYNKCQTLLELGTSLGINAIYLSHAKNINQVVTIEGNQELAHIAQANFKQLAPQEIELVVSDIDHFLGQNSRPFDFIYIDANHAFDATMSYFEQSMEIISEQGIIVLDDINWSSDMRRAWQTLISKFPDHLYIENHKLGIVFVNVALNRNHFILRF